MNSFVPRKIKFKAWNTESKLLMRLNSIDCTKGELFKKEHTLLQFTGLYDKQEDEIYEMDIVLIQYEKYLVHWNDERNGWGLTKLPEHTESNAFLSENATAAVRLCSFFESEGKL